MGGFLSPESGEGFDVARGDLDDVACLGEGVGIAVRKDDPLADELSAAIKAIREDGSYTAVNEKYFDFDIYGKCLSLHLPAGTVQVTIPPAS